MIEITHVDHVSMGAPDWRPQADRLSRLFGFKRLYHFPARSDLGFEGCTSQVPGTDIEFEVISPAGPGSFLQRFIDERGPGLHHIALEVPDIEAAAREPERLGMEAFGGVIDDGAWYTTFIHPKHSGGILYQLFVSHVESRATDRSTTPGAVGLRRMDHVSMAVPDLEEQIAWQERALGFEVLGRWENEEQQYLGANLRMPGSQVEFEILQPSSPESFLQRFIEQRGGGMHHICLEVGSVDEAAGALKREGIEPWGGVVESPWRRHTFVHPKDSGGVLFQLFEEPAEQGR